MIRDGEFEFGGKDTTMPVYKVAAWVPMSTELHDEMFRPWLRSDRNPFPAFVPLPRLAAFLRAIALHRERARDAWAVLRGRETIYDPEDER